MRKLILALLLTSTLTACSGGGNSGGNTTIPWPPDPSGPPPAQVSMQPNAWQFQFSPGMSGVGPANIGWMFNFPSQDGVHYLVTASPVLTGKNLMMSGSVNGNNFASPAGPCPCTCRPYFEQRGDTGYQDTYRWFSGAAIIPLTTGSFSFSVQFSPDKWSDVNGKFGTDVPQAFAAALASPSWIGITCSGGMAAGHGVYSTSPASMNMSTFRVF